MDGPAHGIAASVARQQTWVVAQRAQTCFGPCTTGNERMGVCAQQQVHAFRHVFPLHTGGCHLSNAMLTGEAGQPVIS